jgi:hypothetical protein
MITFTGMCRRPQAGSPALCRFAALPCSRNSGASLDRAHRPRPHPKAPPEIEPEPVTLTGVDYIALLATLRTPILALTGEGWAVDDADTGPDDDVDVEFERNDEDVSFEITCVDDHPEVQIDR